MDQKTGIGMLAIHTVVDEEHLNACFMELYL